jgi:hypothetical protein
MAEDERDEHEGGGGFMMGLLTGTVLGAGLGMLLAPKRGSELRTQITEQASSLGRRASDMADRARESMNRGVEQIRGRSGDPAATSGGGSVGSAAGPASGGTTNRGSATPASGSTYTGAPADTTSTFGGSTDRGIGAIDRNRT